MMDTHGLVEQFQKDFPDMVDLMKNSNHHFTSDTGEIHLNPFHLEGDVWTHTMMVMCEAKSRQVNDIVVLAALMHDLGKPISRYEVIEKTRARFSGHEGASVFLAKDVIDRWNGTVFTLPNLEIRSLLEIVNWHQDLFKEINHEDHFVNAKALRAFGFQSGNQIENLLNLMTCDGNGRFTSTNPYDKSYKDEFFDMFMSAERWVNLDFDSTKKEKEITVLIGVPCSGKSTWVKENVMDEAVISRDNLIQSLSPNYMTYDQAWSTVDQKDVDRALQQSFQSALREKKNIVVDMTNMSKKSRKRWLQVPKYYRKKAIVFCAGASVLRTRNLVRGKESGKTIPSDVIWKMMLKFHAPLFSEFDRIEWIFN